MIKYAYLCNVNKIQNPSKLHSYAKENFHKQNLQSS